MIDDGDPPSLEFAVEGVESVEAREPVLALTLRVDAGERALEALMLRVRVQIRPELRRYSDAEAARLWELFGPVQEWGRSLRPVPLTRASHAVGAFTGQTTTVLQLPCAFDPQEAAPKYLSALEAGVIPLELLFSGTLSWMPAQARMQTAMIPWDRDAMFRMPLAVWRELERDT